MHVCRLEGPGLQAQGQAKGGGVVHVNCKLLKEAGVDRPKVWFSGMMMECPQYRAKWRSITGMDSFVLTLQPTSDSVWTSSRTAAYYGSS